MSAAAIHDRKSGLFATLQEAITLELATLPPYLTAWWSIRPGSNAESVAILRSVLMEEMLHMTLAANVLSAVGGCVRITGDALPSYPLELDFAARRRHERVVELHLARFSEASIGSFMQIELPAGLPAALGDAAAPELVIPDFTLGQFYADIVAELRRLDHELGSRVLFSGDPRHQISEELFWRGGGRPVVVTQLADAERALSVITAQGEGADGSLFDGDKHFFGQPHEVAHYFRFNQIMARRHYASKDSIHGAPSGAPLAVDFQAVYPIKPDCRATDFAHDAMLAAMNARFNAGYSMMLWQLSEGFGGNPAVFYTAIMNGMQGLSEIARMMVRVPIPGDPERRCASPSFEWNPPGPGLPATAPGQGGAQPRQQTPR